jgi:hypothetical protein
MVPFETISKSSSLPAVMLYSIRPLSPVKEKEKEEREFIVDIDMYSE